MAQSISESIYQMQHTCTNTNVHTDNYTHIQSQCGGKDLKRKAKSLSQSSYCSASLLPLDSPCCSPLPFVAKCLQRRLSCIRGLKSLFSPLNPQGQTSCASCQESKLPLSIPPSVIPPSAFLLYPLPILSLLSASFNLEVSMHILLES